MYVHPFNLGLVLLPLNRYEITDPREFLQLSCLIIHQYILRIFNAPATQLSNKAMDLLAMKVMKLLGYIRNT